MCFGTLFVNDSRPPFCALHQARCTTQTECYTPNFLVMYRMIVYTKDICQLTGKGEKYARSLMKKIYNHNNKSYDLPLTVIEVCDYLRVDVEQAKKWMR